MKPSSPIREDGFRKDKEYYRALHSPPERYTFDPLDLWRHNLALSLLKKKYKGKNIFQGAGILNIGGGGGREAYLILQEKPSFLILADISLTQLKCAEKYLQDLKEKHFICADGERLPLKNKSIDFCIIAESLHHFVNPELGIREMLRVARKHIIIDEPRKGIVRNILNSLFIFLGLKEELERGYLKAYRIDNEMLDRLSCLYKDVIFFPYFIYVFGWYKKTKSRLVKRIYWLFLMALNKFFHSFGNRVIIILNLF